MDRAAAAPRLAWGAAGLTLALVTLATVGLLEGRRGGVPAEPRDWVLALILAPIGARVASYAPRNPCAWLLLTTGTLAGITVATSLVPVGPLAWVREWVWWPGYGLLVLALLLYPTGSVPTRRWRPVPVALVVAVAGGTVALASVAARAPHALLAGVPVSPGWDTWAVVAAAATVVLTGVPTVAALAVRIRAAPAGERGPLVWGAAAGLALLVALVLDTVVGLSLTWLGTTLALPAAVAVGVLRYGLYDIDLLVHRSLLAGMLSACTVGVYVATVALATYAVPDAAAPVAAAGTALAVLPLRRRVGVLVDRWLYGAAGRPLELFDDLARRIGVALTPDEVLDQVVRTVADALRVPFAAVLVGDDDAPDAGAQPEAYAEHGRRRPWPVTRLHLAHRGRRVGTLVVQRRSPDEPWSRRERLLLDDVALQVGPSAAAVQLTRDLAAARERLVRAREEERRRLRNDLHDGVGPALSGVRMQVRAVLARAPDVSAREALEGLDLDVAAASTEVRRIVDGLRPAALDRGLASALTSLTGRYPDGPRVRVTVAGTLDDLPAAVEVAAYRVADEALANVVKHASARTADVHVDVDARRLLLIVTDDGVGPGPAREGGVGLQSMRERCEELGGRFSLTHGTSGGVVTAALPLV